MKILQRYFKERHRSVALQQSGCVGGEEPAESAITEDSKRHMWIGSSSPRSGSASSAYFTPNDISTLDVIYRVFFSILGYFHLNSSWLW